MSRQISQGGLFYNLPDATHSAPTPQPKQKMIPLSQRAGGEDHPDYVAPPPQPVELVAPSAPIKKGPDNVYPQVSKPTDISLQYQIDTPNHKVMSPETPVVAKPEPEVCKYVSAWPRNESVAHPTTDLPEATHSQKTESHEPSKRHVTPTEFAPPPVVEVVAPHVAAVKGPKNVYEKSAKKVRKKKVKSESHKPVAPIEVRNAIAEANYQKPLDEIPWGPGISDCSHRAEMRKAKDKSQPFSVKVPKSQPVQPSHKNKNGPGVAWEKPIEITEEPKIESPIGHSPGSRWEASRNPPVVAGPLSFDAWLHPAVGVLRDLEAEIRAASGFRPVHRTLIWMLKKSDLCAHIVTIEGRQLALSQALVARIQPWSTDDRLVAGPWGAIENWQAWMSEQRELYSQYLGAFNDIS